VDVYGVLSGCQVFHVQGNRHAGTALGSSDGGSPDTLSFGVFQFDLNGFDWLGRREENNGTEQPGDSACDHELGHSIPPEGMISRKLR
jgi:hypothetical protein